MPETKKDFPNMTDTDLIKALTTLKDSRERCNIMGSEISAVLDEAIQRIKDYAEQQADTARLVHDLDVLWNGLEGAAAQARLCDIVAQIRHDMEKRKAGLLTGIIVRGLCRSVQELRKQAQEVLTTLKAQEKEVTYMNFIEDHRASIDCEDRPEEEGGPKWEVSLPPGPESQFSVHTFRAPTLRNSLQNAMSARRKR